MASYPLSSTYPCIPADFGDPLSWFRARGVYFKYMYAVAIPSKAGTQSFSGEKNSTVSRISAPRVKRLAPPTPLFFQTTKVDRTVDPCDYRLIQALTGSEDQLIHCLKPNQPCAASLDQLKGLHNVVLQEREEPFAGLTQSDEEVCC